MIHSADMAPTQANCCQEHNDGPVGLFRHWHASVLPWRFFFLTSCSFKNRKHTVQGEGRSTHKWLKESSLRQRCFDVRTPLQVPPVGPRLSRPPEQQRRRQRRQQLSPYRDTSSSPSRAANMDPRGLCSSVEARTSGPDFKLVCENVFASAPSHHIYCSSARWSFSHTLLHFRHFKATLCWHLCDPVPLPPTHSFLVSLMPYTDLGKGNLRQRIEIIQDALQYVKGAQCRKNQIQVFHIYNINDAITQHLKYVVFSITE